MACAWISAGDCTAQGRYSSLPSTSVGASISTTIRLLSAARACRMLFSARISSGSVLARFTWDRSTVDLGRHSIRKAAANLFEVLFALPVGLAHHLEVGLRQQQVVEGLEHPESHALAHGLQRSLLLPAAFQGQLDRGAYLARRVERLFYQPGR